MAPPMADYMITQFGPLELTAVTTTRKIFTTLYSVFRNPANRLAMGQWGGCGLVFVGMLIDILVQALCPKAKGKGAPPPSERPSDVEMASRAAGDDDESLGEHERVELRDRVVDKVLADGGGERVDEDGPGHLRVARAEGDAVGEVPRRDRQHARHQEAREVSP